ncbi:MAG: rhomboid family protein [Cloacibacterium sp.]|jgi:hypothetical protein|nr:rhomboid family protein [Cloacibacterium sp.]MBP8085301.1 rhomboid family protein [Cloacibacterium sp.]
MNTFVIILLVLVILVFFFRNDIQEKISPKKDKNYTIDDRYNSEKLERQKEIDHLLSKMGKNGIEDLSEKDRKRLDELSQK